MLHVMCVHSKQNSTEQTTYQEIIQRDLQEVYWCLLLAASKKKYIYIYIYHFGLYGDSFLH